MTYDITSALQRAPVRAQEPVRGVSVSPASTDKVDDTPQPLPGSGETLPPTEEQLAARRNELDQAIRQINDYVQSVRRDVQFSVDEDSGRTIVKVLDSETKEVIRQFPPEELLTVAHNLARGSGVIFQAKA